MVRLAGIEPTTFSPPATLRVAMRAGSGGNSAVTLERKSTVQIGPSVPGLELLFALTSFQKGSTGFRVDQLRAIQASCTSRMLRLVFPHATTQIIRGTHVKIAVG